MVIRVAHLSTAHGRRELRVHLKECNSLAEAGYEVHYVVADGLGRETVDKVEIHDLGAAGGRLKRILLQPWRMLLVARRLNAHIYHFHDPEILPIALFLGRGRARVVYDSHEDAPRALLSRDWLPAWLRPRLSAGFELLENFVARRLSGVIGATPKIANRFAPLNPATVNINNFPLRAEIGERVESINSAPAFCYQGGISRVRGICQMVAAFERVDAKLLLAGSFDNAETEKAARETEGWSRVDYRGAVSRAEVRWLMAKSRAGLVLFHPEPNHVEAQPNKMFEYMAAGIPVIASNFALWREIIEGNQCGLCVDPLDPTAIAQALEYILSHPARARQMGENGRRAAVEKYNWGIEEKKLIGFYEQLLHP